MKQSYTSIVIYVLMGFLLFPNCSSNELEQSITYTKLMPVYKFKDEMRIRPQMNAARAMQYAGKILPYKNYIFINELREGIHVYDNSNPNQPQKIGFINIPGNLNLIVQNDILYADNYLDLVAIDIKDIYDLKLLKREKDVFPHDGKNEEGAYLMYHQLEDITQIIDSESTPIWKDESKHLLKESAVGTFKGGITTHNEKGMLVQASTSRFALHKNTLYTVDQHHLNVFDLNNPTDPIFMRAIPINMDWATLENVRTTTNNLLFIGSSDGMLIYDCKRPQQPAFMSWLAHATACDPVVVDGNYAYVSLNNRSTCNGWTNQLDLIDISNASATALVEAFEMENPRNLAIHEDVLYVCQGEKGLKAFDISTPKNLDQHPIIQIKDFAAFDLIAFDATNPKLLVIASEGIHQLDATQSSQLHELSYIPF